MLLCSSRALVTRACLDPQGPRPARLDGLFVS